MWVARVLPGDRATPFSWTRPPSSGCVSVDGNEQITQLWWPATVGRSQLCPRQPPDPQNSLLLLLLLHNNNITPPSLHHHTTASCHPSRHHTITPLLPQSSIKFTPQIDDEGNADDPVDTEVEGGLAVPSEIQAFQKETSSLTFSEQLLRVVRAWCFCDGAMSGAELQQVSEAVNAYNAVMKDTRSEAQGVLEWSNVKQMLSSLGHTDVDDVWEKSWRGTKFGTKKRLTFTEAVLYVFNSGENDSGRLWKASPADYLNPQGLVATHPAKAAHIKAVDACKEVSDRIDALRKEKVDFAETKKELQEKSEDENLSQMKRSQASMALGNLKFDESAWDKKMKDLARRLSKADTSESAARAELNQAEGEYEREAMEECRRALAAMGVDGSKAFKQV